MTHWQRTEGSLLGTEARELRAELIAYFRGHNVAALLEFYPGIDSLVGLSLLVDPDSRVAAISGNQLVSGLELEDLAADIAERFDVGVMVGDVSVEVFDDTIELEPLEAEGEDDDPADDEINLGNIHPVRAVTVTAAGPDYFPVLARSLGEPVTTATAGHHVLLTSPGEHVPGTYGWDEIALPVVQILAEGPDRTVVAEADEFENTVSRTWGSERILVAGEGEPTQQLAAALALINSDEDDARVIAAASPTADVATVVAALNAPADRGPALLLDALGCGREFVDFLDGTLAADELPGAHMWEPASTGQIFRTTMTDALDEAAETRVFELVSDLDARWPAVTRTVTTATAAIGSAILVASFGSKGKWRGAGIAVGAALVLDAFGDAVLYEWLRRRRES